MTRAVEFLRIVKLQEWKRYILLLRPILKTSTRHILQRWWGERYLIFYIIRIKITFENVSILAEFCFKFFFFKFDKVFTKRTLVFHIALQRSTKLFLYTQVVKRFYYSGKMKPRLKMKKAKKNAAKEKLSTNKKKYNVLFSFCFY